MRWSREPPDDPLLLDGTHRLGALLPEHTVRRVLRHRRGVRLDLEVDAGADHADHADRADGADGADGAEGAGDTDDAERLVVSVHAGPSAAGEVAVVDAWHAAGVGHLVPAWATDAWAVEGGRVGLTAWVPGTPLDRLDDGAFVLGAWSAGETLAALHRSSARLARAVISVDVQQWIDGPAEPALVPTLGGAVPSRVCVLDGVARWFDVAASGLADPAVDVAPFVRELRWRARPETPATLRRDLDVVSAAVDAFCDGYGIDVGMLGPRSSSVTA